MQATITGSDPDQGIGVEVFDENNLRHWIALEWDGSIRGHETDDYPHSREDRTKEEQRIMTQVEQRARYEAHQAFPDENVLSPALLPETIERGIAATQEMPADQFGEVFREYYHTVLDPSDALPAGVSADQARAVTFAFAITDDDQFDVPGNVNVFYVSDDGVLDGTNPQDFPPGTDFVKLYLPITPDLGADLDYPEDFFALVQANLVSQARDRYLQMGMEPPEEYQVDTYHIYPIPGSDEPALMD